MIHCPELNKDFESKELLFKALRENESKLIDVKKGNIYKSSDKGQSITTTSNFDDVTKTALTTKEDHIYPIINTIGFLDSHNDLHIEGIWNKSVREQQGRVHYVVGHELEVTKIITWKTDVKMLVKDIEWSLVGKPYGGSTQALIFEIPKDKIELEAARKAIDKGWDIENSVRMRYMDVKLCYNSEAPEDAQYKRNYDKYYPMIANKDDFENINYFYAILQAQIVDEGSMVVKGSNSATRVIQTKHIEPPSSTQADKESAENRTITDESHKQINHLLI